MKWRCVASAPPKPCCRNFSGPSPCLRELSVNCAGWCGVPKTRLWWVILPYLTVLFGIMSLRNAWGALIGFHLSLLPALIKYGRNITPRFLAPVSMKIILPAALTGLAAGLGLWFLWPYSVGQAGFAVRLSALGLSGKVWPPFIIYFTLVNPILEELYWRMILTSASPYPVAVDFLFAGYHLLILNLFVSVGWLVLAFVVLGAASWFWRQISRYTNSLLPAVLSHMLADFSILLVIYRLVNY